MADESIFENDQFAAARMSYIIESAIYALAMLLGLAVCFYTLRRFNSNYRRHIVLAARLVKFKISLTVADLIVLYVYAPTQIIWIITYNWYGGDFLCRTTKFINTFSLHLTANMQVLIAADRLYITTHLRQIHQKSHFATNQMIALAWIFAIACALPQLFVFHVYILPDDKPQCVSVWTVMRFREYLQQEMTHAHYLEHTAAIDLITIGDNLTFTKKFNNINDTDDSDMLKVLEHDLLHHWNRNAETTGTNSSDRSDKINRKRIYHMSMLTLNFLNRRCNETLAIEQTKHRRSSVAWKNTVALARRKTRRKAFLMLTLNMIFWTPYCVMGILSTIMEFDHSGYDFLNALVVLNAVSNLLL
ncbi:unnamed protein product [Acanthocheilonema viteae]|uniref:G-protein coupled receptors family 1 profile domain-containing protein n=1 Tax=Acanthocheilonema viteae TaxID=6277 RepID=A0A498S2V1_ACAVI|nr:unnamed protein product [Acanthocheilonema viteae]